MKTEKKLKFFEPDLFFKNKVAIIGSSSSILKKKMVYILILLRK